jgi:hypothetical protein
LETWWRRSKKKETERLQSGEMVASYYAHKEQSPNDAEGAEEELEHIE